MCKIDKNNLQTTNVNKNNILFISIINMQRGYLFVFLSFCVYIIKEKSSAYTFFSRTQVELLKVVVNLEVCDATGAS